MPRDDSESFDRRKFLKRSAVPAAALMAGCTGGGGGGGGNTTTTGSGGGGGGGGGGQQSLVAKAREEGKVNIVASMSNTAPFYKQQFNKQYPKIKTNYQFKDMGKTSTQLVQSASAGKMNIDMTGSATTGSPLTAKKLVEEGILRKIPQRFADDKSIAVEPILNNHLGRTGWSKALTLLYNKNTVKSPPKSLDELFTDKWKGKITVDVRDSELWLAAKNKFDSTERAKQFCRNLGEYGTPRSSHFDAAKQIARGEVPMGITYIKYTNYEWGKGVLKEAQIPDMVKTGGMTTIWLPANAPHPDAAELAARFSMKNSNLMKYFQSNFGKNVFYTLEEWNQQQPDIFVMSPEIAQGIDPDKVEKTWEQLTGFTQTG